MELSVQFQTKSALTPGVGTRYSFNRGPRVPHSRPERFWEETNFFYLTFIGPFIANIFSENNQQDATFLKFIYFCKTLYMFQTGFPSIIRSTKLHIQRQAFVGPTLLPAASLARLAAGSSFGLTDTCCCMCSFVHLMMDGKTVWNM